jgi:hypothetical protein
MASTYTTNIRLEKQGDGENPNTWGLRLNGNVIDLTDEAVAGYAIVTLTTATETSLTVSDGASSKGRSSALEFIGTLEENVTVVMPPSLAKSYYVYNSVTGNGKVLMKPSGGSVVTTVVSAGKAMAVITDGTKIHTIPQVDTENFGSAAQVSVNTSSIGTLESTTLRNNAANVVTTGPTRFNDSVQLNFGTDNDVEVYNNGSNFYFDVNNQHEILIRDGDDSNATRFTFAVSAGNFTATGDVTAFSDERLKSNIQTLDAEKAFEMRGVSFEKDGRSGSGVIAQELEQIAPELVNNDGEYKAVAYGNIVGYLIEAVKLLKKEVDELKGK